MVIAFDQQSITIKNGQLSNAQLQLLNFQTSGWSQVGTYSTVGRVELNQTIWLAGNKTTATDYVDYASNLEGKHLSNSHNPRFSIRSMGEWDATERFE